LNFKIIKYIILLTKDKIRGDLYGIGKKYFFQYR
jgi:hypothetical protein